MLRSSEIQEMSLHNKDQLCHPFMAKLYKSVWGCLKPVWRCCGHIGGLKLHVCYCPTPPPWGPSWLYGSWISCVLCIRCKKMYLYLLPNIPMVHFWRDFRIKIFCWELFPFNAGKLTPFIQSSMNIAYIPHNLSKKTQLVTFLFAMKLSVVWFGSMVLKRHFQPYFSYIVAISFIDGGNRSTRWKPPTCRKSLTNFILILARFKYLQIMQRKLYSKFFFLTSLQASTLTFVRLYYGCPTGQVKKSDSQTCRYDRQIYFHWYKLLGFLYKRPLFDLQFVHNLFWLKLSETPDQNCFIYISLIVTPCFDEVQGHWQN